MKASSFILAIAMLICGCQAAPAQPSSAAPVAEPEAVTSEPTTAEEIATSEEESTSAKDEAEESSMLEEIETVEKVYINGLEVVPAEELLNRNHSENEGSGNGINGYLYGVDWVYKAAVIRDAEENGYVLANYRKRSRPNIKFCFISDDEIGCLAAKEFTVYDFPMGEAPKLRFSCNLPEDKVCEYLEVWYDATRDEYVAAYQMTEYESGESYMLSQGIHHVEVIRLDSNGSKIDGFTVDVLNDDNTYIYDGNYENGKLWFTSRGYSDGAYQKYYITYDFDNSSLAVFEYDNDILNYRDIAVLIDIEYGEKTENEYPAIIKTQFIHDQKICSADIATDAYILFSDSYEDFVLESCDVENKKLVMRRGRLLVEADYETGVGKAFYSPIEMEFDESWELVDQSTDGRYEIYLYDSESGGEATIDRYCTLDTVNGKCTHLSMTYHYSVTLTDKNDYIYWQSSYVNGESGLYAIGVNGRPPRMFIDTERVDKEAAERLGIHGAGIVDFDFDKETNKVVFLLYDYNPDRSQRYPCFILGIYDSDGNCVKHVLTEEPVVAGKFGFYQSVEAENGKAFGVNYLEEPAQQYHIAGNRVWWQPKDEKAVYWQDYETNSAGRLYYDERWGELLYAGKDFIVFRNTADGSCWKSDFNGVLKAHIKSDKAAEMHPYNWYPLPDFSGILYVGGGEIGRDSIMLKMLTKEGEDINLLSDGWYGDYCRFPPVITEKGDIWVVAGESWFEVDVENRKAVNRFSAYDQKFIGNYLVSERHHDYAEDPNRDAISSINSIEGKEVFIWYKHEDHVVYSGEYTIYNDVLCDFTLKSDGVHYRTLDLITNEQKSILTDLPADYDDLRVVTVTDSGKVIIALQTNGEWKIFTRDAKI